MEIVVSMVIFRMAVVEVEEALVAAGVEQVVGLEVVVHTGRVAVLELLDRATGVELETIIRHMMVVVVVVGQLELAAMVQVQVQVVLALVTLLLSVAHRILMASEELVDTTRLQVLILELMLLILVKVEVDHTPVRKVKAVQVEVQAIRELSLSAIQLH